MLRQQEVSGKVLRFLPGLIRIITLLQTFRYNCSRSHFHFHFNFNRSYLR